MSAWQPHVTEAPYVLGAVAPQGSALQTLFTLEDALPDTPPLPGSGNDLSHRRLRRGRRKDGERVLHFLLGHTLVPARPCPSQLEGWLKTDPQALPRPSTLDSPDVERWSL